MSAKQNQIGLVTLLILTVLTGWRYNNQIGPVSTISAQAISTTDEGANTQYALLYANKNQIYSYVIGDSTSNTTKLPSTFTSYLNNNLAFIEWSNNHHEFLLSVMDQNLGLRILHSFSDKNVDVPVVDIGRLTFKLDIFSAQWSPDGQSLALIIGHINPQSISQGGYDDYTYLAVYGSDGKLHLIVSPETLDANGRLTMKPKDNAEGPPEWSSDGKYIMFSMRHEINTPVSASNTRGFYEDVDIRTVSTDCLSNEQTPCKIRTLKPQGSYDSWYHPTWLSDSQHLIFDCESYDGSTATQIADDALPKEDICEIASDGSGFRPLSLPYLIRDTTSEWYPINYALSPDGNTLAYTQTTASGIYLYNLSAKQIISTVQVPNASPISSVSFIAWLPIQSLQAFSQLPTLTPPAPTATLSMKLSLKPECRPAGLNSLNQDVWEWHIINPNPTTVLYSLDWFDISSKKIKTVTNVPVASAKNGIPEDQLSGAWTQPGPNKVHLYVDGVLQDEQTVPPLPCPGSTPTPTPTQ